VSTGFCVRCGEVTTARRCDRCAGRRPSPPAGWGVVGPGPQRNDLAQPHRFAGGSTAGATSPASAPDRRLAAPGPVRLGGQLHPRLSVGFVRDGQVRVVGEPQVRTVPDSGVSRLLRALAVVLGILVVLTTPSVLSLLLVVAVIAVACAVLFRWLGFNGFGRGVGRSVVGVGAFAALSGGGRSRGARPALAFRIEDAAGRVDHVDLVGHDVGVALGDSVRVTGWRVRGRLHARSVRNLTTGVVFRRPGLVEIPLLLAVVSIAALVVLDRFLSWTW
jgi:hypothetical protein